MVLRAVLLGHRAGPALVFVLAGRRAVRVVGQREGLDPPRRQRCRERRGEARIHATREVEADGHVAQEPSAHPFLERGRHPKGDLLLVHPIPGRVRRPAQRPVGRHLDPVARRPGERLRGAQAPDAFEGRLRVGHVLVGKKVVDRDRVEPPLVVADLQQTLDLGGEVERPGPLQVVERLLARVIAREQAAFARIVPDGDGEHAEEPRGELGAPVLVEVGDDLGVRSGTKAVPLGLERGTDLGEVVELAVLRRPHRPGLVGQRLPSALHVDDAEAPRAQGEARAGDEELVVRAAIRDAAEHHLDGRGIGLAEDAGDAAHG